MQCSFYNTENKCTVVAHQSTTHVTLTFIPDVVTTLLALHVMEDGWLAAPEGGASVETVLRNTQQQ